MTSAAAAEGDLGAMGGADAGLPLPHRALKALTRARQEGTGGQDGRTDVPA